MPLPTCSISLPVSERPFSASYLHDSAALLIRPAERDSDGFLKLESLDFFETPTRHRLVTVFTTPSRSEYCATRRDGED
jgi:hypothetical protein